MKLANGPTRFFPACDIDDPDDFLAKATELLSGRTPAYAWINNEGEAYRYWEVSCLYVANGQLTADACFDMGGYTLEIKRNTRLTLGRNGAATLSGWFEFGHDRFVYEGTQVELDSQGAFHTGITISSCEELNMGMRYFDDVYDSFLQRTVVASMWSPVIRLDSPQPVQMTFHPFRPGNSRFTFEKEVSFGSLFNTLYADPIRLCFDQRTYFTFQPMYTVDRGHRYYLCPAGTAIGTVEGGTSPVKFMPGFSGSEYISIPNPFELCFVPGQKAYFRNTYRAKDFRTAYIMLPEGNYYSQPDKAGYFQREDSGIYDATELVPVRIKKIPLPVFPYKEALTAMIATTLEKEFISQRRREIIEEQLIVSRRWKRLPDTDIQAVTRHGMKVCMDQNRTLIRWIKVVPTDATDPGMAFTYPSHKMMTGLHAANLFAVLQDISAYAESAYAITQENLLRAEKNGYKDTSLPLLYKLDGKVYYTSADFRKAVEDTGATFNDILVDACDCWNTALGQWRFNCSPRHWEKYNTVMVVKQTTQKSLMEFIDDPSGWSPSPSVSEVKKIQSVLKQVSDRAEVNKDTVLQQLLRDTGWTGSVLFNVGVDISNLPSELSFLMTAINKEAFKALYIAFPAGTSVDNDYGAQSPVSALIDYRDELHQFFDDFRPHSLKVLTLRMSIVHNRVRSFLAQAELLINRIFEGRSMAAGNDSGNNLVFNGSFQQDDDGGHYTFTLDKPVAYTLSGSGVTRMEFTNGTVHSDESGSRFTLGGRMQLYEVQGCDLFSFDCLGFEGYTLSMQTQGDEQRFAVHLSTLQLDTGISDCLARADSFYNRFPVTPLSMQEHSGTSPKEQGFTALKVKGVPVADMETHSYSIIWRIEMGNLGELAGKLLMNLDILTAWKVPQDTGEQSFDGTFPAVTPLLYTGLRLGAAGNPDDWNLPLQGVLTLGFDAIELMRNAGGDYLFRFRNFGVKILDMRFPFISNDMYLVSDRNHRLGWYGEAKG